MAQLPVTKELRLGCPAYVCGGGPGDHTSSGWSSSSTELYRNHNAEDLAGEMAPAKRLTQEANQE